MPAQSALAKVRQNIIYILYNPAVTTWLAPLLLVFDAALCAGIITYVPYTEIDWSTYMQHIDLYIGGERDYDFIKGSTGPLVYPGFHVYIYRALHYLTRGGEDVRTAQWIFMGVYLAALGSVLRVYRAAGVPPWVLPMLVLSKRMHSIFLLRLFNDSFAVLFLFTAIYLYQKRQWTTASVLFSCALGVKMSVLLMLPTLGLVLLMAMGQQRVVTQILLIGQVQVLFGYEFLKVDARAYASNAFQLNRAFLYKWTVNWRFIPESTFLSSPFAITLLMGHVSLLAVFAITRWVRPTGRSLTDFLLVSWKEHSGPYDQQAIYRRLTPQFIATALLTANAIGMLFARSLHYQFYSWTAWSTPLLLWKGGFHPVLAYLIWAAQEWAWNVYPSTNLSSAVVVGILAVQVGGIFWGTRKEFEGVDAYATPAENVARSRKAGFVDGPRVVDVTDEKAA